MMKRRYVPLAVRIKCLNNFETKIWTRRVQRNEPGVRVPARKPGRYPRKMGKQTHPVWGVPAPALSATPAGVGDDSPVVRGSFDPRL